MSSTDPASLILRYPIRPRGFQDLMRQRVQDILLVMSPYDRFILEQDGQLQELFMGDVLELNFTRTPGLTRVSSAAEALKRLRTEPRFNLVLTAAEVGEMDALELARAIREDGHDVPVVLLGYDARQLEDFLLHHDTSMLDRAFLWQGDGRILAALISWVEDRWNAPHDCEEWGVQAILLVEDSIRYYSSYLPIIYEEILRHTHAVLTEGVNLAHRLLRLRARPKVLLCSDLEEAREAFVSMRGRVLGIIADVELPSRGRPHPQAGLVFAREVNKEWPDIPILLQSSRPEVERFAHACGASFLLKGSPTLLTDLRRFLQDYVAMGDFVFRNDDGEEVGRAGSLPQLLTRIGELPSDVLVRHGRRNDFSAWLRARTEFPAADRLRWQTVEDFGSPEDLREGLLGILGDYLWELRQGELVDFDPERFDPERDLARIGSGSVGGKARGLAFVRVLLTQRSLTNAFPGVRVSVPPGVIIGTGVFDYFMKHNDLIEFALHTDEDAEIDARFAEAEYPSRARESLREFLEIVRGPLAVRSSSLLEDSQLQPFSGVYDTYLIRNTHPDMERRLDELLQGIKRVYASIFHQRAKAYVRATPYRLEEEKMAVVVQRLVGARRGGRFYPDFAGVAQSWNYYPTGPMAPQDGVASVVLGLGQGVTEGSACFRFSPAHPRVRGPFGSPARMAENCQSRFSALRITGPGGSGGDPLAYVGDYPIDMAEADGTLGAVASTWQPENNAVYDGISRQGVRLVTFAPVLKHGVFPLADILFVMLQLGKWGMAGPVEIEFAVNRATPPGRPAEFRVLQMRPLVVSRETAGVDLSAFEPHELICRSDRVMGNGRLEVKDVILVDRSTFRRADSRGVAREIAKLNKRLSVMNRPYLLVGVGRWGSRDPWLGIPVEWSWISGARAIIETGFQDFDVEPSQGTHFFQNLMSFGIGYFTVNRSTEIGFVDWDWLTSQEPSQTEGSVRHLRFDEPIQIWMDGQKSLGLITRPGVTASGPKGDEED